MECLRAAQESTGLMPGVSASGSQTPIVIDLDKLVAITTGRWHAGRWAGGALLIKFVWKKGGVLLSSGFLLSGDSRETEAMVGDLERYLTSGR